MKLLHRVGYYLGGFSIGLIILAFFLNGKKVSCDYGPEARVLKNINSKELQIPEDIYDALMAKEIDSLKITNILKHANIRFSDSDTRKEPCGIYYLENTLYESKMDLKIENCDSIVTIQEIVWK